MRGRLLAVVVPALCCAAFTSGCSSDVKPPAPACMESPQAFETALAAAPAAVRLHDGTRLSQCVSHAVDSGPLQNVGATLVIVATDLEARARSDRGAALRLGYLLGAVRRGASTTNGVGLELVRRIEAAAALPDAPPATLNAEHDGIEAGRRYG